jgi:hypothetical protein
MRFIFNFQTFLKLSLLSCSYLLLLNSVTQARQIKISNYQHQYQNDRQPITIPVRSTNYKNTYRALPLRDSHTVPASTTTGCIHSGSEFISAETQDFYIFLCGDSTEVPDTYIGVAKHKEISTIVPLTRVKPNFFAAVKGATTYTVTPKYLTIYLGDRIILQQSMLRYDSQSGSEEGS